MEDATKKRRGRPTVLSRQFDKQGEAEMQTCYKDLFSYDSKRSYTNLHYHIEGDSIAKEFLGEEETRTTFYTKTGNFKGAAILEQIGRMSIQDGYSRESCKEILQTAIKAMKDGYSIKFIEKWIRHGRTTGRFEKIEAASNISFTDQEIVDAYKYLDLLVTVLRRESKDRSATLKDYTIDFETANEIAQNLRDKFKPKYKSLVEET